MWFRKAEWMSANGYPADAVHVLWIALGLRIKDAVAGPHAELRERLRDACSRWLSALGWDWRVVGEKVCDLRQLIDTLCAPSGGDREAAGGRWL